MKSDLGVLFVNVAEVGDGVYIGNMDTTLVKVTVEVSISDHRITDIRLLRHINGQGQNAEKIIDDMLIMNTTDVEIVSGATMSSKVIIAAVKDALIKGVK